MSEQNNNIATEKLKIAMVKHTEITNISKLAKATGMSAPNASNKLSRNDLRESELRKLADALGYDVEINLVSRITGEKNLKRM